MEKLFKSLFDETQCDKIAKEDFLRNKLFAMKALEMTAGELLAEAKQGGWDSWLKELSLAEFNKLLIEPGPFSSEQGSNQKEEDIALIQAPPKDIDECIVGFLRTNPWSDANLVATGIDLPVDVIEKKLKEILAHKFVKSVDDGKQARFALM